MQRWHFRVLVAACLLASAGLAASAFTSADLEPRAVVVSVVADADAYVSAKANPATPHACFVDVAAGKLSLGFDATGPSCTFDGGGAGINGGDGSDAAKYGRYAFHDLLLVTNQGMNTVRVWINATTTSTLDSALTVAGELGPRAMTDADYSAAVGPFTLAPGEDVYVGVRVHSGKLQSSSSVTGAITIEARLA